MALIDCTLLNLAFSETGIISRRQFDVVMHWDVNDGSLGWSGMFVRYLSSLRLKASTETWVVSDTNGEKIPHPHWLVSEWVCFGISDPCCRISCDININIILDLETRVRKPRILRGSTGNFTKLEKIIFIHGNKLIHPRKLIFKCDFYPRINYPRIKSILSVVLFKQFFSDFFLTVAYDRVHQP